MRLLMRCLPEKVTAFCLIGFFCWFGKGYGQNCNADFTFSAACNVVTFTPGAQSDTLNYNWSFGDGNTSTAQMPVHTYFEDSAGNYSYEVTLIVNGNCIPDTVTQTVNISIGALPDVVPATAVEQLLDHFGAVEFCRIGLRKFLVAGILAVGQNTDFHDPPFGAADDFSHLAADG